MTLQNQILQIFQQNYPDIVVKKIDKDNFLDIHIPSVNEVRGTHLFFNIIKNKIKFGFYCRDKNFIVPLLAKSNLLEEYSQGVRLKGNPEYATAEDASIAASHMLSIMLSTSLKNSEKSTNLDKLKFDEDYEDALFNLLKEHRILSIFSFIPDDLLHLGFTVDSKMCFFYVANNTFWADGDQSWDLLIDLHGFNSRQGGDEFKLLFDWDSLVDVKIKVNNDDNSVVIGLFQGDDEFLSIEQKDSQSIKVIYYLYNYIMKDIIAEFKDESAISWSTVENMGITRKNFNSYQEFYDLFE